MSTLIAYFLGVATGIIFRPQILSMWDKVLHLKSNKLMPLDVVDDGLEPVGMETNESKTDHKVDTK